MLFKITIVSKEWAEKQTSKDQTIFIELGKVLWRKTSGTVERKEDDDPERRKERENEEDDDLTAFQREVEERESDERRAFLLERGQSLTSRSLFSRI